MAAPGMVPGGFVNYIALLAEVRQEIVGAENELSVLLESGRQQDKRVFELRIRLEELKKELVDLQVELKACKQKEERQREELTEVEQQVLSKELRLITVKGEVATLQRELDEAVCEEMKVEERIAHLKEEMEASAKKLKTAHTPGWHYAPVMVGCGLRPSTTHRSTRTPVKAGSTMSRAPMSHGCTMTMEPSSGRNGLWMPPFFIQ